MSKSGPEGRPGCPAGPGLPPPVQGQKGCPAPPSPPLPSLRGPDSEPRRAGRWAGGIGEATSQAPRPPRQKWPENRSDTKGALSSRPTFGGGAPPSTRIPRFPNSGLRRRPGGKGGFRMQDAEQRGAAEEGAWCAARDPPANGGPPGVRSDGSFLPSSPGLTARAEGGSGATLGKRPSGRPTGPCLGEGRDGLPASPFLPARDWLLPARPGSSLAPEPHISLSDGLSAQGQHAGAAQVGARGEAAPGAAEGPAEAASQSPRSSPGERARAAGLPVIPGSSGRLPAVPTGGTRAAGLALCPVGRPGGCAAHRRSFRSPALTGGPSASAAGSWPWRQPRFCSWLWWPPTSRSAPQSPPPQPAARPQV
ncbi:collagen alpha-1(I) chain-like isoform X1 [Thamnophis elegans]|uniref:collagen alpha-1(I) chain-like isoform X1 n=1 Tax=Thamnophis elegans TaxID=35005 RepID=UPI0013777E41|nr:collagen alpha-1(I) chain-like isoform X1 [Thamnophis elegans]